MFLWRDTKLQGSPANQTDRTKHGAVFRGRSFCQFSVDERLGLEYLVARLPRKPNGPKQKSKNICMNYKLYCLGLWYWGLPHVILSWRSTKSLGSPANQTDWNKNVCWGPLFVGPPACVKYCVHWFLGAPIFNCGHEPTYELNCTHPRTRAVGVSGGRTYSFDASILLPLIQRGRYECWPHLTN